MLLIRTEFSKGTTLLASFKQELSLIYFMFNSGSYAVNSDETVENEANGESDDDSISLGEAMINEDETKKRKKRKRITTRARKVIPGLSFLILQFLLEYFNPGFQIQLLA